MRGLALFDLLAMRGKNRIPRQLEAQEMNAQRRHSLQGKASRICLSSPVKTVNKLRFPMFVRLTTTMRSSNNRDGEPHDAQWY
jgi:hypothetical protein